MKKLFVTWQIRNAEGELLDKEDWYLRVVYSPELPYREGDNLYAFDLLKTAAQTGWTVEILP